MGREAGVRKIRKCGSCEKEAFGTAKDLQEHASLCERAKEIGLILPGIEIPTVEVIR